MAAAAAAARTIRYNERELIWNKMAPKEAREAMSRYFGPFDPDKGLKCLMCLEPIHNSESFVSVFVPDCGHTYCSDCTQVGNLEIV